LDHFESTDNPADTETAEEAICHHIKEDRDVRRLHALAESESWPGSSGADDVDWRVYRDRVVELKPHLLEIMAKPEIHYHSPVWKLLVKCENSIEGPGQVKFSPTSKVVERLVCELRIG